MIESEFFKAVVSTGSFGLLVFLFIWFLMSFIPSWRGTLSDMTKHHQVTVDTLTKTFETSLQNQLKSFEVIVANMQREFRETIDTHEKQCRGERKEWIEAIRTEGILNRDSRNDMVTRLTELYARTFMHLKGIPFEEHTNEKQSPRG